MEELTSGSLSSPHNLWYFNEADTYENCLLYCTCEVDTSPLKVRVTLSAQFTDYHTTSGENCFHLFYKIKTPGNLKTSNVAIYKSPIKML